MVLAYLTWYPDILLGKLWKSHKTSQYSMSSNRGFLLQTRNVTHLTTTVVFMKRQLQGNPFESCLGLRILFLVCLILQTGSVDLQVSISVFDAESSCMSVYHCHCDRSDALSDSRFLWLVTHGAVVVTPSAGEWQLRWTRSLTYADLCWSRQHIDPFSR
jgi:hypothetical protein